MTTAISLIISMSFLTFMVSLYVHASRVDFYANQERYTQKAIRDGLTWPYTFVRVIRDYITRVK